MASFAAVLSNWPVVRSRARCSDGSEKYREAVELLESKRMFWKRGDTLLHSLSVVCTVLTARNAPRFEVWLSLVTCIASKKREIYLKECLLKLREK